MISISINGKPEFMKNIKISCAKQCGTSHQMSGLPCQDEVYGMMGAEGVCIALADGAGSVEGSEKASSVAVKLVAEQLSQHFTYWYDLEEEIFCKELSDLCRKTVKELFPGYDADCTLLASAVALDGRVMLCHIGDGFIFGIGSEDTGSYVLSKPENGDQPNLTYFFSSPHIEKHLRRYKSIPRDCSGILLCSDGAGASLWDGECARAIGIMVGWVKDGTSEQANTKIAEALDQLFRENTEDDMSIAILTFDQEILEDNSSESVDIDNDDWSDLIDEEGLALPDEIGDDLIVMKEMEDSFGSPNAPEIIDPRILNDN